MGAIALLALGTVGGRLTGPAPPIVEAPVSRLAVDVPDHTPVANRGGLDLAISRDGRRIAFLADTPDGRKIFVRDLPDETIRALSGTEGADDPFFSWDGRSIGFESRSNPSLMRVSLDGGAPVPIAGSDGQTRGAWWGADDAIVYGARNRLWRVPAAGGTPQALIEQDAIYGAPHVLPDGGALLFNRGVEPAEIQALDLRTRAQSTIVTGKDPTYVSSGHLVFARDDKLMAVRFDVAARQARGEPVTLVENLRSAPRAAADIAVSTNGTAAYMLGLSIGEELPLVWSHHDS